LLSLIAIGATAAYLVAGLPHEEPCYTSGSDAYRMAARTGSPDYRVRIDRASAGADLRMQLVDRPELADIVIDDTATGTAPDACASAARVTTVTIDPDAAEPNVTASVSAYADDPHYRLFIRSNRFSEEEIAALVAVMAISQPRYRLVDEPEPAADPR
jgi:hypothetical protein